MRALLIFLFSTLTLSAHSHLRITHLTDISDKNRHLVTEIDLSNKGLTEFPKEILKCYNLRKLDISNNGIFHVPLKLSKLSALEELDLSRNQGIAITDLDTIFSVAKFHLKKLNLSSCGAYTAPLALSNQVGLEELDLSNNRIASIPSSWMRLSSMKKVDLSGNRLRDFSWVLSYWWELKEIDLKNNPELTKESVIKVLSFFDRLNRVELSGIDELPTQFQYMNVRELIIHDSYLSKFPRAEFSSSIEHLEFKNCGFKNSPLMVRTLNEYVKPNYLVLEDMDREEMIGLKGLDVDSVTFIGIESIELSHLIPSKKLKWVDLRSSSAISSTISRFTKERPEVEILYQEPVSSNVGINPPIQKFAPVPTKRLIDAAEAQQLTIGSSRFTIPEETFISADGELYTGDVTLEYTEYMNPLEIALSGITMTAESNGETMMLSSGGMFTLNAKDDQGNELFMNPSKAIDVQLTSPSNNPDMIVWELNDQGSWEAAGEDTIVEPFVVDQAKIDSIMAKDWMDIARAQTNYFEDRYLPKVKWIRKNETFEISFEKFKTNFDGFKIYKDQNKVEVLNPDLSTDFLCRQSLVYNGDDAQELFKKYKKIIKDCKKKYHLLKTKSRTFGQQILNTKLYNPIGPNYFKRVRLLPDFENDRYQLSFIYKTEKVILPVFLKSSQVRSARTIKENQRFFKDYTRLLKKSFRIRRKNKGMIDNFFKARAERIKEAEKQNEISMQRAIWEQRNFMKLDAGSGSTARIFQMRGFGTFNCDVLSRMRRPFTISRNFVERKSGKKIKARSPKVVYVDEDKNGVLTYDGKKKVVIDKATKSTVIVLISATMVGIFKNFRDKVIHRDRTEVELLDISEMSNKDFMKALD